MMIKMYMKKLSERIEEIKQLLEDSEYILIGAGAGLSTAAGLTYSGERFKKYFIEYIKKYDMTDMYTGGFYPFETLEEKWGYWAKQIYVNEGLVDGLPLYEKIYELVKDKKYFVITTNVDDQFIKSGFPSDKVFATQGSYRYFQCSKACHDKLYDNTEIVKQMVESTDEELKIPSNLVPYCPVCGQPQETNLRVDNFFVEDKHWHLQKKAYQDFVNNARDSSTLLLEFGIGYNTPGIIRFPFETMTFQLPKWNLVRFNKDYLEVGVNVHKTYRLVPPEKLIEYDLPNDFINRYIPVGADVEEVIDELI